MNQILSLSQSEFKKIFRDPFLSFIFALPLLIALLYRIIIPIVRKLLINYFDLADYYSLIMIFLMMLSPMLFGWVIGFSLLDDRDEDLLAFMSITPLQKEGYLQFKILAPIAISIVQAYLVLLIANLTPMKYIKLLPVVIIVSLETPMFALAQGSFANNKVEGLAIGKLMSIVLLAPFISYFVDSPLAYLAGIFPPFWITESYFSTGSSYSLSLIAGFAVHILFIFFMMRFFGRKQN